MSGWVKIGSNYYAVDGPIEQGWVPRQSDAFRLQGVQRREDDPSVNRYRYPSFPLGLGWQRQNRETGRGVGGLLDTTCWTALGPVTRGRLQETQSHAAPADHFVKAINFKGDLWGLFEEDYTAQDFESIASRKFGATSDDWTGGGLVGNASSPAAVGLRGFDMVVHKGSLFALKSGADVEATEVVYGIYSSTDGITWADAALVGFPDSTTTNRYLTTTITRRNNFDDDMARGLSFGNTLLYALYRHPSSTDGTGLIEVLSSTDSGANWVSDVTIPSGDGPKALVDWVTIGGVRSPVLVTSEGVYSIDTSANTFSLIYALDGDPNTGRWAEVGNDGALYIGLGSGSIVRLQIREADNLDVMVIGPPGDGLVTARQGRANYILKTPSEWLLLAYGGHAASRNASIFMIDTSVMLTDPETGKRFMPWHHLYQDGTANLDIVALAYSTEDDGTARAHFAVEGAAASINYHIEEPFVHPAQSTTVKHQATSVLRLPDDDLGDPQINATLYQVLVNADDLSAAGGATDDFITVRYGLDGAADTTVSLGNFLSGQLTLSFGSGAGVAAKRVGINLLFDGGSTNTTKAKMYEFELQAQKVYVDKRYWASTINIENSIAYSQTVVANTPVQETIIAALETLAEATTLSTVQWADNMTAVYAKIPPGNPPVFNLVQVGSGPPPNLGYRTGTVRIRLEEAT